MSKDHNTITCTHSKGLACPVCYDQTHRLDNLNWAHAESQHDLSQCGDACNCMKCNPSKSSCIALRASELNMRVIDHPALDLLDPSDLNGIPVRVGDSLEFQPLPGIIRFNELEDGAEFWLAQTFAYGGRQKLQKTLEDGGPHNAVYVNDHHIGLIIPDNRLVIRV